MRAHVSPEIPDGELPVRMNGSNEGEPFGVIELGRSAICCDTVEDARALLAAAARVIAWFETPPAPHAFQSMEGAGVPCGPCVHCGRIRRSELHAGPVITDSGRTCDQRNPDGSGEPCHRDGEHARHRDSNGDEWGEAATAANPPHHAYLTDEEECTGAGYRNADSGYVCTAQDGHDGPDHVAYKPSGGEYHRWPVATGTPLLVTGDEVPAGSGAPDWCPAFTVYDEGDDHLTLYCDRERGHHGSHHAPGPDEGSEVAWSDEAATAVSA